MGISIKDKSYLWDINEACNDILKLIRDIKYNEFKNDKMRRIAVERQLLVVGEAANHLSKEIQNQNQHIPWANIIGLRNIIAHDYGEVLVDRIWLTAIKHIPELQNNVKILLT